MEEMVQWENNSWLLLKYEAQYGERQYSKVSKVGQGLPWHPVVKTLCFQWQGHRFDPWSEN